MTDQPSFITVASGIGREGYLIVVMDAVSLLPIARINLPEWEEFRPASAGHRLIEHGYMTNSAAHFKPETAAGWYPVAESVYAAPVHRTEPPYGTEDPGLTPAGLGIGAQVEIRYPPKERRELTNANLYKGSAGVVIGPDDAECWFVRIERPKLSQHAGIETSFRASDLRVITPAPVSPETGR